MTLLQKCKQINQAFIHKYLPMNRTIAQCGNELLFRDEQENLILVKVSYINKSKETALIQFINDKAIAKREKQIAYENNKNA